MCESSNEKRKFGSVPWSVAGGERMSGFWLARTGFFGPGLVPPLPGRVGCGIGGAVCACATVAAESAPPAAATASMSRREMEFEIELIFLSLSLSDGRRRSPQARNRRSLDLRPLSDDLEWQQADSAAFATRGFRWPQNRLHAR
jgi:hypothetical protein